MMALCVLNRLRVHTTPFNPAGLSSSSLLSSNTIQIRLMIWTFQDIYDIINIKYQICGTYTIAIPRRLVVLEIMYTVNAVRIFIHWLTNQPAPTSSLRLQSAFFIFFLPFIFYCTRYPVLKFWNNTLVRVTCTYATRTNHWD